MKKVVSIVLNWNRLVDTVACVHSLLGQHYLVHRVVVIDNDSTDGSEAFLRTHFLEQVELIQTGSNLGFGGGNVGIAGALSSFADYIWLVNNDATVTPQTLGDMVKLAEGAPRVGAVGARVCRARNHQGPDGARTVGRRENGGKGHADDVWPDKTLFPVPQCGLSPLPLPFLRGPGSLRAQDDCAHAPLGGLGRHGALAIAVAVPARAWAWRGCKVGPLSCMKLG